jgi:ketosteroid isomerase-like protein
MDARRTVALAAAMRAAALAQGDASALTSLLHDEFAWTTHVGTTYGREEYVRRNTDGHTAWRSQTLEDVEVVVVGDTAVLRGEAVDVVDASDGSPETFRMPVTQTWVRTGDDWRCLAGHAGPRRR